MFDVLFIAFSDISGNTSGCLRSNDYTSIWCSDEERMEPFLRSPYIFIQSYLVTSFYIRLYKERPLGRPRLRWEDNIKMDLREVGGGGGDWMELAQDRDRWRALVRTVRNLRVPKMRGIS